ncbi:uncharacterized protein LOC5513197 [Nematostella vectensis]|uniref:uncharacterized protein LOC5513197 n=1 Tax=Nematostella vectensis TaxID=45351 RepID=UPI00207720CD|nr:uncharacterized protein LOC5513197 [Nematostella vectensis]XP_048583671.1 uncharacterized protein LOC5513197 [Nematostella vectensis]XP_048583672.1 uncharacterized protein LOC5513197 [Nematostella vectensis]XP_048583673.1 uncharacterized protein LOC5513197 [Nematostella vectensis]XP_048583674.1 uncharacterized protein LOC5513197 [Nematostella vectensis]
MKTVLFVLQIFCLLALASTSQQSFCPASIHSEGARITQVNLVLRSKHVKKRLQGQSQMSCSQRCLQQDWCISVNYEVSRPEGGACELNTYGVEMMADANPDNPEFETKTEWIYSQLRSAQFTASLQECRDNFCSNGGTCEIDCETISERCKCVAGYTGMKCETDIDECSGNPCANGGTCTDGINSFTCVCPAGYTGSTCETDIDECATTPCQNGAICNDGVNNYTCSCNPGYTGANCETEATCDIVFPVGYKSGFPVVTFSSPEVELDQFAVCAWYSLYQKWTENVILSYVTSDNRSQLEVTIKRDGKIGLSVNWKSVIAPLLDKFLYFEGWHFFCIGYKNDNKIRVTRDSEAFGDEDFDLLNNGKLTGGGKLVLGAAQRCFGGCFQESSMFKGDLTNVNIFNKKGTTTYYHCMTDAMTDSDTRILKWSTIQRGHPANGTISATCPTSCNSTTVQDPSCEFHFPNRSTENFVAVPLPVDLSECTICAWYSLSSEWKDNVILSYVTSDNSSQLQVVIKADGKLELMVNWKTFIQDTLDLSGWHKFCVQWKISDQKIQLHRDSATLDNNRFAELENQKVSSGGELVIGAAQRCYGGCFQESLTFRENLTQVNIWKEKISGNEVGKLNCGGYRGSKPTALHWKTIQAQPLNGAVRVTCDGGCSS